MAEVQYAPEVEYTVVVPDGMLDTMVIEVPDDEGRGHALRVPRRGVTDRDGKGYLPIGLVTVDRARLRALVELPTEADSGTRRIWVPLARFRRTGGAA